MLSAVSRGSGIDGLSEPYRRTVGPLPTSALGAPPPGRGAPNRPAAAVATPPILASAATAQKRTNATISYPRLCPASSLAAPNAVRPGEVVYTSRKPLFASSFGPVPHVHDVKSLSQMNEMLGANLDVHKGAAWELGRNIFHFPMALFAFRDNPNGFAFDFIKRQLQKTCVADYFLDGVCNSMQLDEKNVARECVVNVAVFGPSEVSNEVHTRTFEEYTQNAQHGQWTSRHVSGPFSTRPEMAEDFLVYVAPRLLYLQRNNVEGNKIKVLTSVSERSYSPSKEEAYYLNKLVLQCNEEIENTPFPADSDMVEKIGFIYFEIVPTSSKSIPYFLATQSHKNWSIQCSKVGCVIDTSSALKRNRSGCHVASNVTLCVDCATKTAEVDDTGRTDDLAYGIFELAINRKEVFFYEEILSEAYYTYVNESIEEQLKRIKNSGINTVLELKEELHKQFENGGNSNKLFEFLKNKGLYEELTDRLVEKFTDSVPTVSQSAAKKTALPFFSPKQN